jgi:hypothetical protein
LLINTLTRDCVKISLVACSVVNLLYMHCTA